MNGSATFSGMRLERKFKKMEALNNIHLLTGEHLNWDFDRRSEPYYRFENQFRGFHYEYVDPFPCYTHDFGLVKELAQECFDLFPIQNAALDIFVLPHEGMERTNGWHSGHNTYRGSEEGVDKTSWPEWYSFICLNGKRVPIMKVMTRQLVSHEYGHMVEYHFRKQTGMDRDEFLKDYARVRGIEYYSRYGAGHWHKQTGEIFANDFRVLVCNREPDHWPHEVSHPKSEPNIQAWWEKKVTQNLRDNREETK